MTGPLSALAVAVVCLVTLGLSLFMLRLSRRTSDFYVAGRTVSAGRNAAAIGGEYLSAASFLGVAGFIYDQGVDALWYPIGYTVGYLVLLILVAAPMRRSGAYTLPDFAEARLGSVPLRRLCTLLVVLIGWLYLIPQFQGADFTLRLVTGAPTWVGSLVVAVVVILAVAAGGMRSITLVQAVQYWVKLTALAVPAGMILGAWWATQGPAPAVAEAWTQPFTGRAPEEHHLYRTFSLIVALALGTTGLPHVVVRYYTNPDGAAARRTTVRVLALLGLFYVFTIVYGVLGRAYLPVLGAGDRADTVVLRLPAEVFASPASDILTAALVGGAFAAFLSTSSGLAVAVTGVLNQDLVRPLLARVTQGDSTEVSGFRFAAVLAVLVPYAVSRFFPQVPLAAFVTLAFVIAASTFFPLLALGVWWPRLSVQGAAAGLTTGAVLAIGALVATGLLAQQTGWPDALLAHPAAWTVPAALLAAVGVSLATPHGIPPGARRTLVRLHTPEVVTVAPLAPQGRAGSPVPRTGSVRDHV
ncbi:sodium/solute symporter [Ornithinimicrobium avium]|uniref:Cation acetate symporter n=1 Tax=Ornithinimicrobium avium TaxID=2283195 RepID=A0A345NNE6_9MICO|nr:cation acetate symporter [Ornithinimicrobium avium]AXH96554.1 cation acetate symporter [Ornithinimicrobium avium]